MRAIVQVGYGSLDVLKLQEIERPVVDDNRVLVRDPRGFGERPATGTGRKGTCPYLVGTSRQSRLKKGQTSVVNSGSGATNF